MDSHPDASQGCWFRGKRVVQRHVTQLEDAGYNRNGTDPRREGDSDCDGKRRREKLVGLDLWAVEG